MLVFTVDGDVRRSVFLTVDGDGPGTDQVGLVAHEDDGFAGEAAP